jgi:two-component system OmpR family response regulator
MIGRLIQGRSPGGSQAIHGDRVHDGAMTALPLRALAVDDDPGICELLRLVLTAERFVVATAGSGEETLACLETFVPDVVLLDIMLPDMTGFDLATLIRARVDAPIIFVTARDVAADRIRGLTIGDDYIAKPFSLEELVARVRNVARRRGRSGCSTPV